MNIIMSFLEAVRRGIIQRGDQVDISALLSSYSGGITLMPDETGFSKEQVCCRENLKWYFEKDEFLNPILYSSTTKFTLHLQGLTGLSNIQVILNKIAKIYENKEYGYMVRPMSYKDFQNLDANLFLKLGKEWAWTDDPYVSCYDINGFRDFGVRIIGDNNINYFSYLYNSNGREYSSFANVHLAISILNSNIQIYIGNKDGRRWMLLPPPK